MKTSWLSILKYNRFEFGKQIVSQFVIFECKYLFSIILFYFHRCDSTQDRYHTHAFNAVSFKLFGQYTEYLLDEKTMKTSKHRRKNFIQYFPRNSFHMIGNSTGCMTILLSGKWKKQWKEYNINNFSFTKYTWNRK